MYYPSSQITPNLHTNGGELQIAKTGEDYKGYYFKVSNGRRYTGKTLNDGPNILLREPITYTPTQTLPISQSPIVGIGNSSYKKQVQPRFIPPSTITTPTPEDYKAGYFTRYFSKKNNELKYAEISKESHNSLKSKNLEIAWDLYSSVECKWMLNKFSRNAVYSMNEIAILNIERNNKWWGFSQYFKEDFSKYYVVN
jgi:hypothetical protein